MRKYHFLIALFIVALDRATKLLVAKDIGLHNSIPIIPRFFYLTHFENRGAAFGLFDDSHSQWKASLLVLFSIAALIIVSTMLWRSRHSMATTGIGLAMIMGGAIGNLWDRLFSGKVVDFLLVYIGSYEWPAFNVADSAIVIGAGLLLVEILFAKSPTPQQSV